MFQSHVTDDGMTRAPCLRFSNVAKAVEAKAWIESPENYQIIKQAFDSQSRFARLQRLRCRWGFHELFKKISIFTLTFLSCLTLLTWLQWHDFFFQFGWPYALPSVRGSNWWRHGYEHVGKRSWAHPQGDDPTPPGHDCRLGLWERMHR